MKKVLGIILATSIIFVLTSCGKNNKENEIKRFLQAVDKFIEKTTKTEARKMLASCFFVFSLLTTFLIEISEIR